MGKLNYSVLDLGSSKNWALVQDRSQVTQRQSGAVVWRERGSRLAGDFINLDPLLGSTRLVGSPLTVLPKCSTGLK
jgi:hypothetical protein